MNADGTTDDYDVITTKADLKDVVKHFRQTDAFAFDTETLDFAFLADRTRDDHRGDPFRNTVVWLSMVDEDYAVTIPMGHPNGEYTHTTYPLLKTGQTRLAKGLDLRPQDYSKDERKAVKHFGPPPEQLELDYVMEQLEPVWFDNPGVTMIAQNAKFDVKTLAKYYNGDLISGFFYDTLIGAWLLDSRLGQRSADLSLDKLVELHLKRKLPKGVGKEIEKYSFDEVAHYSANDSIATFDLAKVVDKKLGRDGMSKLMNLEMDVLAAVIRMELHGAPIDIAVLKELHAKLEHDLDVARGQIYKEAGRVFNINSNVEKQQLLYAPKGKGGRGLRTKKVTSQSAKEKAEELGEPWRAKPVDAETLGHFKGKDALVDGLLNYADLNKLHGTYVIPYLGGTVTRNTNGKEKTIERPSLLLNGRIHGTFKQNGAETGRFASNNPNLQNIPNGDTPNGKILRSLFYAPEGYRMVIADYSQIEPRIIASLSQDPILHGAYDRGEDVYVAMARPLGLERKAGKVAILAMSYGVGPDKIEEQLELEPGKGREMLDQFEKTYHRVYEYKRQVAAAARNRAPVPYVQTVLGRRRYLPDLKSYDKAERGRAERQCFNALIQGTAADIMKIALVRADQMLADFDGAQMLLTVHDEIVTLCREEDVDDVAATITEAMQGVRLPGIDVPLVAAADIGDNWSAKH